MGSRAILISPDMASIDRLAHKLTLVLGTTAQSKAVCDVPKESDIFDIDGADDGNPLAVSSSSYIYGYMDFQYEITEHTRMKIVNWLIGKMWVQNTAHSLVLYLAVQIFDRYLSMNLVVPEEEMKLIGVTAMFIASKYEEVSECAPKLDEFADSTDNASYSTEQILAMEKSIMVKFKWTLPFPNAYHFLVRFLKAAEADVEMENMVFSLMELGLMHYAMLKYCPSMLAASAVYAAHSMLMYSPLWDETLKLHTGYSESQLIDCAAKLVSFHSGAAEHESQTVFRKYSCCVNFNVARLQPANDLLVTD
ncbi:hypothetical protein MKW98_027163 [Papaver atlanticum]|uniref:Cyclin N-terminal domain-containing protein n=1 Tax=Papaver atlanticum TaxID=357466 RepID=A0AAD4T4W7_9MAGN|nr:hypothetical protein MKW98_027163 [Papaver atlanticum]